jgi:uncharacterized protein YbaP (TraB family)
MKRISFIILSVLAFATVCNAQLLWKISGNGLAKPSYVFGTDHVSPLSILDKIAGFNDAFSSTKQLYGEIDMKDMQGMVQQLMPLMQAPQDSTLDVVLTPAVYNTLDSIIKSTLGVSVSMMKILKPAAVSTQLEAIIAAQSFSSFDPTKQLDATLQSRAKTAGMDVNGFETVAEQANLLFSASISEQAKELTRTVKDFEKMKGFTRVLSDNYMNQDIDGMFKIMMDPELGSTPAEMDKLIFNRNANWVTKLKTIMPAAPTFIVVGAGHLPGPKGLIALLRAQGFSVTPVK